MDKPIEDALEFARELTYMDEAPYVDSSYGYIKEIAQAITARDERIRREAWQSIDLDAIDDDFYKFLDGFTDVDGERYEKRAARNGGEWMKHLILAAIMGEK
jgi:hypothetical protein